MQRGQRQRREPSEYVPTLLHRIRHRTHDGRIGSYAIITTPPQRLDRRHRSVLGQGNLGEDLLNALDKVTDLDKAWGLVDLALC